MSSPVPPESVVVMVTLVLASWLSIDPQFSVVAVLLSVQLEP